MLKAILEFLQKYPDCELSLKSDGRNLTFYFEWKARDQLLSTTRTISDRIICQSRSGEFEYELVSREFRIVEHMMEQS